jgi:signal transduction histidine kinase
LDDSTIFTGSAAGINQLIVLKESIGIIVKILLFLSIVLYVIVHLKQRRLWLIPLAALVAAIWFNVGIMLFLPVIYMASDGLFKKQQQLYALLAFAVIGVFVPLNALKYAAGFYLLLAFVNYYKRGSRQALKGLVVLAICYSMAAADLEFSFFKLFFEEAFMAVIAGYLMIESLWQFKLLLSKEQMIKVELLRGIAHDLRLPVSTISLNTDLLMRNDFDTELRKGKTLNIIKSALEDLTYMISSLSIYTANEHFVSSQFRASIQDAIQHTAKHFQNSQKHIVIRMDLCQEECYLPIEEIWLNRLIFNLVDNAYKYTDDYGEIDITLTREKKAICLSVKDNGIGIAPEARQRILEPFYRVDSARQATGMGLGLSIVKTIVDALGGEIHIESELGEYTVFEIRL